MGGAVDKIVDVVSTVAGAVVGFMVGGPIGAVIGAGLGYASADVVNSIINPGFDVPNTPSAQAEQQNSGITVNKQGTNESIPVVYGRRRVGGIRLFVSTEGENNKYLHIVLALSEGEIDGIEEIYMDDFLAWQGNTQHGERYNANVGKYKGNVTFEAYHGKENQTAAPLTAGVGGWGSSQRLRGIAYISFRLEWVKIESQDDQDESPWSNMPNITVVMRGKKVADATQFVPGEIERPIAYEDETVSYNSIPINCLLDYLRNPIYGKGLTNDKIDFASFQNEAVRWLFLSDGVTPANFDQLHACNAVIFTDRTLFDNVKTFLFNCRAALPYQNGRFAVKVEDNRQETSIYGLESTPVMTIDENNILNTVNIESDSVKGKYNRVVVRFMGGKQGEELTNEPIELTFPEPGSSLERQYLEEDNGRVNENVIVLEHVTQDSIARKYAEVALNKSRFRSKTISFTADASLHQVTVNDIVRIVHSGLGFDGKFRIKSLQFNADYTFTVIAEEHNDIVYAGDVQPFTLESQGAVRRGEQFGPVYQDIITGDIVHIGNKSDAPLTSNTANIISGGSSPNNSNTNVDPQNPDNLTLTELALNNNATQETLDAIDFTKTLTQSELEQAVLDGRVVATIGGEQVVSGPSAIPKPIIKGFGPVSLRPDIYRSFVSAPLFIQSTNEPSIVRTEVKQFDPVTGSYRRASSFNVQNSSTAASDGFIQMTFDTDRGDALKNINIKIQFVGEFGDVVKTSDPFVFSITNIAPGAFPGDDVIIEEL